MTCNLLFAKICKKKNIENFNSSPALGQGWRLGFLGLLHMDVFCQRLSQEYDIDSTITAPSVTYKLKLLNKKLIKEHGTDVIFVSNPTLFPDAIDIEEYFEPVSLINFLLELIQFLSLTSSFFLNFSCL